jgi:hypothetical protein
MSVVAVVEGLAWLISIGLAAWMVLDLVRVARRNDEQALVDAPDPLEELPDDLAPAPPAGQDPGRVS